MANIFKRFSSVVQWFNITVRVSKFYRMFLGSLVFWFLAGELGVVQAESCQGGLGGTGVRVHTEDEGLLASYGKKVHHNLIKSVNRL